MVTRSFSVESSYSRRSAAPSRVARTTAAISGLARNQSRLERHTGGL